MRLVDNRPIGDKIGVLGHRAFPGIARKDELVIVCWRQARTHATLDDTEPNGTIYVARSLDGGRSFGEPFEAFNDLDAADPLDLRDPSIDVLPDGRWICWYFKYPLHSTPTVIVTGRDRLRSTHCRFSSDDGLTWGAEVDVAPVGNAKGRGHILVRDDRDSTLMMPVYGYPQPGDGSTTAYAAYFYRSSDGGATWRDHQPPMRYAPVDTPSENEVIALADGRWLAQWRTGSAVIQRALSDDQGLTFGDPWTLTGITGVASGLIQTEDEAVHTFVRRPSAGGLSIVTTATPETVAVDTDATFRAGDFSTGYLSAVQTDARSWLATYYRDRAESIADCFIGRLIDAN